MPKYIVTGIMTVSCYTIIEDDVSEHEAIEIARDRPNSTLCINPWTDSPTEAWVMDELDAEPIRLEAHTKTS